MKPTVQSVERALFILEALCDGEIGIIEMSEKVGLNKTTVHRLLGTLLEMGYVKQNPESLQYGLTPKLLKFGESVINQMDIVAIAKPHLKKLSQITNETIHLVSLEGNEAVYIDKLESKAPIRMYSYIGKHIPLYCTAVGKVFLAYSNLLNFDSWYEEEKMSLVKLTTKTITERADLKKVVQEVKERGYAIDDEENEYNIFCVSAPIIDHLQNVRYAISVSSPKFRTEDRDLDQFIESIRETAKAISVEIGGNF